MVWIEISVLGARYMIWGGALYFLYLATLHASTLTALQTSQRHREHLMRKQTDLETPLREKSVGCATASARFESGKLSKGKKIKYYGIQSHFTYWVPAGCWRKKSRWVGLVLRV